MKPEYIAVYFNNGQKMHVPFDKLLLGERGKISLDLIAEAFMKGETVVYLDTVSSLRPMFPEECDE